MDIRMAAISGPRERFDSLDRHREALGLAISALCRRADISEHTYLTLKRNADRSPRLRTVLCLERALTIIERGAA